MSDRHDISALTEPLLSETSDDEREFPSNVDPGMKQLMHDAIASQIKTFRHEIDHYERLRDGRITSREITYSSAA
jgi:hypothetical protein